MAFIGKSSGFCQRHFDFTESPYCPSEAIIKTGQLVRSPVTLDLIRKDVKSFKSPSPAQIECEIFDQVVRDAYKAWQLENTVKPIHLNDLPIIGIENAASSPGLPWRDYFRTKGDLLRDPIGFQSIRRFWHMVKEGKHPAAPDCAAYLRSHIVERGEEKVRAIWGYPATVSFQEACFALPLMNAYKKEGRYPTAYGYETARGGHRKLFNRFHSHPNFMSSDYKGFDKTVPSWLIRIAFNILCCNLNLSEYEERGVPDSSKLFRVWQYLVDYFINTPIRLCNGERYRKRKGVASGSYFTQLIDSIVNWIVTTYSIRMCNSSVLDIVVMGDDSLVALTSPIDLEEFTLHASKCGMEINVKKTQFSDRLSGIKFLGYTFNNGTPVKNPQELWASLRFPERPDYCYDDIASRAMGLLIANFGSDYEFDCSCRNILSIPWKVRVTPSMGRFLKILGIDQLPTHPPTIWDLGRMRM